METIEVEVRGRIASREKYEELAAFFRESGVHKETKNRLFIDYSTFLPEEGIRERTRDIRLRITNGVPEIITKVGNWGGQESRKEISVKCEQGSFDRLVQNYAVLGYTKGTLCVRNSEVFDYKGIEFALVEVPGHSYYFEAEKIATSPNDTAKAHEAIEVVCKEIGLDCFTEEQFFEYVEMLNEEANGIFDFKEYTEGFFAKTYNL